MSSGKIVHNNEDRVVVLPCDQNQFGEFVKKLLGKPQEIKKATFGLFHLAPKDLTQVYHLVVQRIAEQNKASLVNFLVEISYSDGSSITLQGFEEFEKYNEVNNVTTSQVTMTWSYVIEFESGVAPEKQDIDLTFVASGDRPSFRLENSAGPSPALSFSIFAQGAVFYRIRHTKRTWGADVDNILDTYVRGLLQDENSFRSLLRQHSEKFALLSGATFLVLATVAGVRGFSMLRERLRGEWLEKSEATNDTFSYVTDLLITGRWHEFSFYMNVYIVGVIIVAIVLGLMTGTYCGRRRRSLILFTKKDDIAVRKDARKHKRNMAELVVSAVATIGLGLTTNLLFQWIGF